MKKKNVEEYFTKGEFLIDLKNEDRKYFALNEILASYERTVMYSRTYDNYKRTTIFFDGDTIVKVIYEERSISEDNEIILENYYESDTYIKTRDKKFILPLTSRGKEKSLTPTNIMAIEPFGCVLYLGYYNKTTNLHIYKPRNHQEIPHIKLNNLNLLNDKMQFFKFVDWYISTCPPDYFDKIERLKNTKPQTIKFKSGDIFRAEYDREKYCYGLVIGKIKDIVKWTDFPKKHSFHHLMCIPMLVRMYDLITERSDLGAEDLKDIPLLSLQYCSDAELLWGVHPIVSHKTLEENDVEFHLYCSKEITKRDPEEYNLYIEWGLAHTIIPYKNISQELKSIFNNYRTPFDGVSLSIDINSTGIPHDELINRYKYKNDFLSFENRDKLNEIFKCLNINDNTTIEEFNHIYGGISKAEFIKRINKENL